MTALADRDVLGWGVASFSDIADVVADGEEARALGVLVAAGLPVAEGWLASCAGPDAAARTEALVQRAFTTARKGDVIRLRALFPSRAVAARFEKRAGLSATIDAAEQIGPVVSALFEALGNHELRAAVGGGLGGMWVRVVVVCPVPYGRAASADPFDGDPDQIRVWETRASPWLVDRRTARITGKGAGHLDGRGASLVADLADRAQLALGYPVELEWATTERRRHAVVGVRPLQLIPAFTHVPHRLISLIAPDEGTVAPMSVDALDRALRLPDDVADEAKVRRIYARPYRRLDETRRSVRHGVHPSPVARAGASAARVLRDLSAPLGAASQFDRALGRRLSDLDAVELGSVDDEAVLTALRERQALVAEALALLDRMRAATIATLRAIETAVGGLPAECYVALAQPRVSKARRRIYERLERMGRELRDPHGELVPVDRLSLAQRRKLDDLASAVAYVRVMGLDVRPEAFGASHDHFYRALRAGYAARDATGERARRDATRRLLATARAKPFGRPREAIVRSLSLALGRVAAAKGVVAEGLAAALLRLREGAVEAGRRMVAAGIVDEPTDALYLYVAEIGQALTGEPGAYAARVRLRREDDARWAGFMAPRRIERRRRM